MNVYASLLTRNPPKAGAGTARSANDIMSGEMLTNGLHRSTRVAETMLWSF